MKNSSTERFARLSRGCLVPVIAVVAALGPGCGEQQQHEEVAEKDELEDKTLHDYHDGCLASGCHAGLKKTPRVHGPVVVGACDACHRPEGDASDHLFALTRPPGELCGSCHPVSAITDFVHEPYAERKCVGCHDPHGGETISYLVGGSVAGLCASCHELRKPEISHAPVENGSCLDCHASHASRQERLLRHPEQTLCLKCHSEEKNALVRAGHVHEPVGDSCSTCHVAHGSEHGALLESASSDLCIGCHEDVQATFAGTGSSHAGLAEGGEWCTRCHSPHTGSQRTLLRAEQESGLCLSCHDRPLLLASGRTVAAIAGQVESARLLHGPVRLGECSSCHRAHSSPRASLLDGHYPGTLYAEFSLEAYDLCFRCHNRRIVTDERYDGTGFRHRDLNLHYVHTHREKGRSCGACHELHAADRAHLMRTELTFGPGKWKMPLAFSETDTGGTCGGGCHQGFSYDNSGGP